MTRPHTIENMFVQDFMSKLRDHKKLQTDYITQAVQEDYSERVGYIRALKDIQHDLETLLKAYYPDN